MNAKELALSVAMVTVFSCGDPLGGEQKDSASAVLDPADSTDTSTDSTDCANTGTIIDLINGWLNDWYGGKSQPTWVQPLKDALSALQDLYDHEVDGSDPGWCAYLKKVIAAQQKILDLLNQAKVDIQRVKPQTLPALKAQLKCLQALQCLIDKLTTKIQENQDLYKDCVTTDAVQAATNTASSG